MNRKPPGKAAALYTAPYPQPSTHTVLPPNETWLNTAETMRYFRVSERTLLRWRNTQQLPCLKVGGTILYPLQLANQLLLNRIVSPDAKKERY